MVPVIAGLTRNLFHDCSSVDWFPVLSHQQIAGQARNDRLDWAFGKASASATCVELAADEASSMHSSLMVPVIAGLTRNPFNACFPAGWFLLLLHQQIAGQARNDSLDWAARINIGRINLLRGEKLNQSTSA